MNVKLNLATIQKPKPTQPQIRNLPEMRNTVQKHSPYFADKKLPNLKNTPQNLKKPPSQQHLTSAIDLINKLTSLIKQIAIAPFVESSLITSLNLYLDHLKKHQTPSAEPNNFIFPEVHTKVKALSKNTDPNQRINKSLQNPRKLVVMQNKVQGSKAGKTAQKQNVALTPKLKQNHSKVVLPQISKDKLMKKVPETQPVQDIKQRVNQKTSESDDKNTAAPEEIQQTSPQVSPEASSDFNFAREFNKTPKSRFFELKDMNSEDNDECMESVEQLESSRLEKGLNESALSRGQVSKYDEVLDGLKKRLASHVKLVSKLEEKIQKFENKKPSSSGSGENKKIQQNKKVSRESEESTPRVVVNSPKNLESKSEIEFEKIEQGKISSSSVSEDSGQLEMLRRQLQQREEELKSLWLVLQERPLKK